MRWEVMSVILAGLMLIGCNAEQEYGAEGGRCYPNGTCNEGLSCHSDLCVFDEPRSDILDTLVVDEVTFDTQTSELFELPELPECTGESQCISTDDSWCFGKYRHYCERLDGCLLESEEYCDYGCSDGSCCPYNPDCSEEGVKWCSGTTRYYCVKQDGCLERRSEECNNGCTDGGCLVCQDLGGYCETGDDCCQGTCDAEKWPGTSLVQNVCCKLAGDSCSKRSDCCLPDHFDCQEDLCCTIAGGLSEYGEHNCCPGLRSDTEWCCQNSGSCSKDTECCGYEWSGTGLEACVNGNCCTLPGYSCNQTSDCCGATKNAARCSNHKCCITDGTSGCDSDSDCCSGNCLSSGRCD